MKSLRSLAPAILAGVVGLTSLPARSDIIGFEDLPNGPTVSTPSLGLNVAVNPPVGGDATYDGIVWDSRLSVVHSSYNLGPGSPLFGLPHSGDVYLTAADDHILITTTEVLTSAWFGRNVYYGYGANGTDQITVNALHGSTVLDSITYNLPRTLGGLEPEPLTQLDTSEFLSLTGITGYRIDRHEVDPLYNANNWIGDDFDFVPVPETSSTALAVAGALVGFGLYRRIRR